MEVRDGKLVLHEYVQTHVINHPIDIFLRSLAREYESHAVAVILSGTGSDGTNGIRAVKEQGGVILVQRPETAKFDGMPRSALQTGFADLSIGPEAIADELTRISASISNGAVGMSNEELLNKIYSILKKVSNINYTYYKQTTITRRIERRMVVNHVEASTNTSICCVPTTKKPPFWPRMCLSASPAFSGIRNVLTRSRNG